MGKDVNKGDVVIVYWLDADDEAGWQPHDEEVDQKAKAQFSAGCFVSQGPKFITLSHSYNEDADEWLGKHRIPVGWVERVEVLKEYGDT